MISRIKAMIGPVLFGVTMLGGIAILLQFHFALGDMASDIVNGCHQRGRVIHRGLCLEPETVEKIINEHMEFAK